MENECIAWNPVWRIQKNVEYREKEFRTYEELRSTVMKWAINKKIERERSTRGDPMDTNQAEDHTPGDDWSGGNRQANHQTSWWEQEWPSEENDEHKTEAIDYASPKGKGKGKGGKGNLCYNCGIPGHRAFECHEPKREGNRKRKLVIKQGKRESRKRNVRIINK